MCSEAWKNNPTTMQSKTKNMWPITKNHCGLVYEISDLTKCNKFKCSTAHRTNYFNNFISKIVADLFHPPYGILFEESLAYNEDSRLT